MSQPNLDLSPLEPDSSSADAALKWLQFGYTPIPTLPGKKQPSVNWKAWSENLDEAKIRQHYAAHPDHEVACLTNDDLIVFDADSDLALAALESLEAKFGIQPKLIVKTLRGIHHHFRRAGAIATQDAHDSAQYPERIDIRTGRSTIMMPPSGGRSIVHCEATGMQDLSIATQDFIDAVFIHNGREAPSIETDDPEESTGPLRRVSLEKLTKLLDLLDPGMGYQDWLNVGMALFHETGGSSEGFALFDRWSGRSKKYGGTKEIEVKWKSFKGNCSNPITVGTLVMLAKQAAPDSEVHSAMAEDFEPCSYEVVNPDGLPSSTLLETTHSTPFHRFSLKGKREEIEKNVTEAVFVLEGIALLGETTVIYAPPNSGKTLITLAQLKGSIEKGRIDPNRVYYLNMDDSARGLEEKFAIAEDSDFHLVVPGYLGFTTGQFFDLIFECIEKKCARGTVLVLDTLKKLTNLMDKTQSSQFGNLCRQFTLQGGTIIALAHTNKKRGANGALVPGGTSDILDDVDCAFVIDKLPAISAEKTVVEFENIKRRGSVSQTVKFSFQNPSGATTYRALFDSVEMLSDEMAAEIEGTAQRHSDALIIDAITESIRNGTEKKMELLKEVGSNTGASREAVIRVLDRYCGPDLRLHLWHVETKARGAKVYSLAGDDLKSSITAL